MKDFTRNVSLACFVLLLSSQVLAFKLTYRSKKRIYAPENEVESVIEKRGAVSAFLKSLAIAAGVTSVGTLTISAYVESQGCCKPYNFCAKQKELAGFHQQWLKKSEELNDIALQGSLQITSINSIHTNNEILRTKLVRIIRNLDKLVYTLFDSDLNALKRVQAEIDKIYRDNKDKMATWTVDDFNIKFRGVWGDPLGMSLLFAPALFEAGSYGLSQYLKWSRMRKIEKTVAAELSERIVKNSVGKGAKMVRLLQGTKAFSQSRLIKETTLSQYKASFEARSNFKKAAGGFFSLVVIGFNLWQTFEYQQRCTEVKQQVDKNHAAFTAQFKKLEADEKMIQQANANITKAYNNLTLSISSDEFLAGIEGIEDLVRAGSTQNQQTKDDAESIKRFRVGIGNAVTTKNNKLIGELQKDLSDSLGRVEYHYDCFLKKATALREILTGCKEGRAEMRVLYEEKKKSLASCIINDDGSTPPYLRFTDVENAVKADAGKHKYHKNCPLNNANLKKLVCMEYCNKYPNIDDIAKANKLSNTEVTALCANHLCELAVFEKSTICQLKQYKIPVEMAIANISPAKKAAAMAHYAACP